MAKTRINTRLVAFLTVMGIVLTVVLVVVVAVMNAKHDPNEIRKTARELETAGDRERAANQYMRAYQYSRDPNDLVEAARVELAAGIIDRARSTLATAAAAHPTESGPLVALLNLYWELQPYGKLPDSELQQMKEHASKLLALDPNNSLALVSRYFASQPIKSDGTLNTDTEPDWQRLLALDPNSPRVVLLRVDRAVYPPQEPNAPPPPTDPMELFNAFVRQQKEAQTIAAAALAAHPDDPSLVRTYVAAVAESPRYRQVAVDPAFAKRGIDPNALWHPDDARRVLNAALAARPHEPDLHELLADVLREQVENVQTLPDAERTALLDEARTHYQAALQAEHALYNAYIGWAKTELLRVAGDADLPARLAAHQAALGVYERGVKETIGVESLRARFGQQTRLVLLNEAFDTAVNYMQLLSEPQQKLEARTRYAQKFVDDAKAQYPNERATWKMQGHLALLTGDQTAAAQAFMNFEKYEPPAEDVGAVLYRLEGLMQLANIYAARSEWGKADEIAGKIVDALARSRLEPPLAVDLMRLQIQTALGKYPEGLARVEELLHQHPQDQSLLRAKVGLLVVAKRFAEASEVSKLLADKETDWVQGTVLANQGNYRDAEEAFRRTYALNPSPEVLSALVRVMLKADRRAELAQFLDEQLAKNPPADLRRLLDGYRIIAKTPDQAEQDRLLLEFLKTNPDPLRRAYDQYSWYLQHGRTDEARQQLDELERVVGATTAAAGQAITLDGVLELQFRLALQKPDVPRAESYLRRLTDRNVDHVGGALYRAQLAEAQQQWDRVLTELRTADAALPADANIKLLFAKAYWNQTPPQGTLARDMADEAVRLSPNNAQATRLQFFIHAELGLGETDPEYAPMLRNAAKLNPGDIQLKTLVERLNERDDPASAIVKRQELRTHDPNDLPNLLQLVQLYRTPKIDQAPKAEETLQAALAVARRLDPTDPNQGPLAREVYGTALDFYGPAMPHTSSARYAARTPNRTAGTTLLQEYLARTRGADKTLANLQGAQFAAMYGDDGAARAAFAAAEQSAKSEVSDPKAQRQLLLQVLTRYANYLSGTGATNDMLEVCRRTLALLTDSDVELRQQVRLQIIDALLAALRLPEAGHEVDAYVKDWPAESRGQLRRARWLMSQNDLPGALEQLNKILEKNKDDAWSHYMRGSIEANLRQLDAAQRDLSDAKRLAPDGFDMRHRVLLANVYEQSRQAPLAEAELREVVTAQPENRPVVQYLMALMVRNGHMPQAQEFVRQLIASQPDNPFWPYQYGGLLSREGKHALAVQPFQKAAELTKWEEPVVVAEYLTELTLADRPRDALAAFDKLPEAVRLAYPRIARAQALKALTQTDEAGRECAGALTAAATASGAQLNAAIERAVRAFDPNEMVGIAQLALNPPPPDPNAAARLRVVQAKALWQIGRPADSLPGLDQVLGALPKSSPEYVDALLCKAQALSLINKKFTDEVRRIYEAVLADDVSPNNIVALNNLAFNLVQTQQLKEAEKYADRIRGLTQSNSATWDTVGVVYTAAGRLPEAQTALQQALLQDAGNLEAQLHMGELLTKLGNKADARAMLEETLKQLRATRAADDPLIREADEALKAAA